jgi:hypothetical protein
MGSVGEAGRSFVADLKQADTGALGSAFLGGVVFNIANLLLVAAIDIAGMAVAFPIGIGLALILGVITNYAASPIGNPVLLFAGVAISYGLGQGATMVAALWGVFVWKEFQEAPAGTNRLLAIIKKAGGKVDGYQVTVPNQKPAPAKFEEYNPGIPDKRIDIKDPAWSWNGKWKDDVRGQSGSSGMQIAAKSAEGAGAEATLTFNGSAVVLIGVNSQSGGRANIYLDGKKQRPLDAYIVARTSDSVLWHVYGLKMGPHTLRIVTTDAADARSKGKRIVISSAVTYRK